METKIGNYKGIEVTVAPVTYTDEDVQNELNYLLQRKPMQVSVEGELKEGQIAVFDFMGLKDGVAFDGGTAKGYTLMIGSHQFIPGFEEQMVGMVKGEERDLNLTFPENYGEPTLAGQAVVFKVTLHDIMEQKPAELNDEFAASLNIPGVTNMDTLMKHIEATLAKMSEQKTNEKIENAIMDELLRMTECDIPQDRVDMAVQAQISQLRQRLSQYGMNLEQYMAQSGMDRDTLRAQMTMSAQEQVKFEMALAKIAELEQITVTDEEITAQVREIAEYYHVTVEQAEKNIMRNEMIQSMVYTKASEVVMSNAVVHKVN